MTESAPRTQDEPPSGDGTQNADHTISRLEHNMFWHNRETYHGNIGK
jgi:hypothetical protein